MIYCGIRYSRMKKGDRTISFCEGEKELLCQMARGRNVIVFDEDKHSGNTMVEAITCLEKVFDEKTQVTPVVNYTTLASSMFLT